MYEIYLNNAISGSRTRRFSSADVKICQWIRPYASSIYRTSSHMYTNVILPPPFRLSSRSTPIGLSNAIRWELIVPPTQPHGQPQRSLPQFVVLTLPDDLHQSRSLLCSTPYPRLPHYFIIHTSKPFPKYFFLTLANILYVLPSKQQLKLFWLSAIRVLD